MGRPGSPGGHAVRLYLDTEDHDALRIAAAKNRMPMSVFVKEAVLAAVKEERPSAGKTVIRHKIKKKPHPATEGVES